MKRFTIPAAAALGLLAACQPQPLSQADEDAIRAVNTAFAAGANSGSADAMTAVYGSDAVIQGYNMAAVTGTAAIHKLWTDLNAPVKANLRVTVTKVEGAGDVAYLTGSYHLVLTSKDSTHPSTVTEDGKYINVLWRQADKSWKIVADAWNANSMPAMPAAAPARPAAHRH